MLPSASSIIADNKRTGSTASKRRQDSSQRRRRLASALDAFFVDSSAYDNDEICGPSTPERYSEDDDVQMMEMAPSADIIVPVQDVPVSFVQHSQDHDTFGAWGRM